jgi:hypothetical protein
MELYIEQHQGTYSLTLNSEPIDFDVRYPLEDVTHCVKIVDSPVDRYEPGVVVILQRRKSPGSKKWVGVKSARVSTSRARHLTVTADPDQPIDPAGQLRAKLKVYAAQQGGEPVIIAHDQPGWTWTIDGASAAVGVITDGRSDPWQSTLTDETILDGRLVRAAVDIRQYFVTGATWAIQYVDMPYGTRCVHEIHIGPDAKLERIMVALDPLTF